MGKAMLMFNKFYSSKHVIQVDGMDPVSVVRNFLDMFKCWSVFTAQTLVQLSPIALCLQWELHVAAC